MPKKDSEAQIESLARVPRDSIIKHTKKDWNEWVKILDKAGARAWTHQETTNFLKRRYRLSPWWSQGVTMGYEVHIGRRIEGRNLKGEYSVTVSKSLHLDQLTAWRLWVSEEGIQAWLWPLSPVSLDLKATFETEDGAFGEVRTFKKNERFRLRWQEVDWPKHSTVQLMIMPRPAVKGQGRSILVIMHDGLTSGRIREQMRERWKDAVERFLVVSARASKAGGTSRSGSRG